MIQLDYDNIVVINFNKNIDGQRVMITLEICCKDNSHK